MILKAGANVVLTTKGIDDLSLKYFVEAGAMAVRRCKKEDLRQIAKATGGKYLQRKRTPDAFSLCVTNFDCPQPRSPGA